MGGGGATTTTTSVIYSTRFDGRKGASKARGMFFLQSCLSAPRGLETRRRHESRRRDWFPVIKGVHASTLVCRLTCLDGRKRWPTICVCFRVFFSPQHVETASVARIHATHAFHRGQHMPLIHVESSRDRFCAFRRPGGCRRPPIRRQNGGRGTRRHRYLATHPSSTR